MEHFINCNCSINIEQTGDFQTKYADGIFNIEAGSIYVEVDCYQNFNKDISNSEFFATVEIKEPGIDKFFELELFPGYNLENFGIVKNQTFVELNDLLEKIQLQKVLDNELALPKNIKSSLKV